RHLRRQRRVRGRDVAELRPERDLLRLRDRLVAEEDHLTLEQRGAHLLEHGWLERLAEVDAVDLGADVAGDRADVESELGGHAPAPTRGITSSTTPRQYGHAMSGGPPPHNGCSGSTKFVPMCSTASSTVNTRCAPRSSRSPSTSFEYD